MRNYLFKEKVNTIPSLTSSLIPAFGKSFQNSEISVTLSGSQALEILHVTDGESKMRMSLPSQCGQRLSLHAFQESRDNSQ